VLLLWLRRPLGVMLRRQVLLGLRAVLLLLWMRLRLLRRLRQRRSLRSLLLLLLALLFEYGAEIRQVIPRLGVPLIDLFDDLPLPPRHDMSLRQQEHDCRAGDEVPQNLTGNGLTLPLQVIHLWGLPCRLRGRRWRRLRLLHRRPHAG